MKTWNLTAEGIAKDCARPLASPCDIYQRHRPRFLQWPRLTLPPRQPFAPSVRSRIPWQVEGADPRGEGAAPCGEGAASIRCYLATVLLITQLTIGRTTVVMIAASMEEIAQYVVTVVRLTACSSINYANVNAICTCMEKARATPQGHYMCTCMEKAKATPPEQNSSHNAIRSVQISIYIYINIHTINTMAAESAAIVCLLWQSQGHPHVVWCIRRRYPPT